jgi:hypothetical protein
MIARIAACTPFQRMFASLLQDRFISCYARFNSAATGEPSMFGFGKKAKPSLSTAEQLEEALRLFNVFHSAFQAALPFSSRAEERAKDGSGEPYTSGEIDGYSRAAKQMSDSVRSLTALVRSADRSCDEFPNIVTTLESCAKIYTVEVESFKTAVRLARADANTGQSDGLARSAQDAAELARALDAEAADAHQLAASAGA